VERLPAAGETAAASASTVDDDEKWMVTLEELVSNSKHSEDSEKKCMGIKTACDDDRTELPKLVVDDEVLTAANVQILAKSLEAKLYETVYTRETAALSLLSIDCRDQTPSVMAKASDDGLSTMSLSFAGPVGTVYGGPNSFPILATC
jgi:hypothetical protein